MRFVIWPILLILVSPFPVRAGTPGEEFFEKQVRPILVEKCQECHGKAKNRGDLRLDSREALLRGGQTGPAIVPGDPAKSLLMAAIQHQGDLQMPPKTKLKPEQIEAIGQWIKTGAPWPVRSATNLSSVAEVRATHWAFQPVKNPPLPLVKTWGWAKNPVDTWILAALEAKGLKPSPRADRRTLIRRLTFDLHGLPPTPEEVEAFVNDADPNAYARLIDRLLDSPRYGERWGRHWLDVARYADSKGYVFTEERRYPYSYTYRDYVIRSFNQDLPYDRFVVEQLAADLLPKQEDNRYLSALGFLTLGRRFLNSIPDIIDDRIDVTMRGLQGLTVGCARCHDHKFDPIPIRDYYSLYGIFASCTEPKDLPVLSHTPPAPEFEAFTVELKNRQKLVEDYRVKNKEELHKKNRKFEDELRALQQKVDEWNVVGPGSPPRAMVLNDLPQPVQQVVFLRGNPGNAGPKVDRQFLEVISDTPRHSFSQGSGRLELAQAIASKNNPLTARVMVNRVWQHHFGKGLVRTPGDFGTRGDAPTHPALLDWLAYSFMEQGWSVKKLHRLLLLSATYQQVNDDNPQGIAADPENRLLWKMNRGRLDLEALRDSILQVAGKLDPTMGGPAVDLFKQPFVTRRTVYGFIDRQNLPGLFRTFDFASPDSSTPQRHQTTVPQQALFLMNSPFVLEQAQSLATRKDLIALPNDTARIQRLHLLLFGRQAESGEIELGLKFLASAGTTEAGKLSAWAQYAQVLLLSNGFVFVD